MKTDSLVFINFKNRGHFVVVVVVVAAVVVVVVVIVDNVVEIYCHVVFGVNQLSSYKIRNDLGSTAKIYLSN